MNVLPAGQQAIDAMLATTWADPEDALLFNLAIEMHAGAIVSRDAGFKQRAQAQIPVFTCEEYFDWLRSERGIAFADIPFS